MTDNQNNDAKRGQLQRLFDRLSLAWRLMVDRRVNVVHKLIPPLALLYILSPVDIAPEIIFGPLGLIDDVGVAIFALEFFIQMAPNTVVKEHLRDLQGHFISQHEDENVVEGEYVVRD